ncbi:hypothetical protein [Hymenobacter sp. PAMC 26628]|uniref:hypothetical protein n=1 Tax=Hymenobacter sp. PAMC 26628 TaxID=1484118 RepID=UPI00077007F8|nr:hypothetical protein [Hymenobacter sp. PAMC 26628]AMJ64600.1 hypothetical protein AXW84_03545 [Hymenobacter sp. PAMC 26628]
MKNYLFLVAGTALSLASCSKSKTTETTTTAGMAGDSTAMTSSTTSNTMYTDEAYKSRSKRIADKYATDMKITDPAMREKISTAYYNRSKRYGEMKTKYASDTTGMGAAMRDYNTATDTEFKGIYTDPAQYKSYESSRTNYNEDSYLNDASSASSSSSMSPDSSSTMSSGSAMSGTTDDNAMGSPAGATTGATVSKSKTKLTDGTKIKVKEDGQVKLKDADGAKMKQ